MEACVHLGHEGVEGVLELGKAVGLGGHLWIIWVLDSVAIEFGK